jgi:hypothetical protein
VAVTLKARLSAQTLIDLKNAATQFTTWPLKVTYADSGVSIMEKLAFENAPQENLQTWNRVVKLLVWGSVGTAALLLIMAATLL